ncbi:MAG: type I DNA topoisomerase [Chloroflexi bacterium]|nr:type I DNA topoisomerase [Chloroflexota bacterium]
MSPTRTRTTRRTAIGRSRTGAPLRRAQDTASRARQPVGASARGRNLVIVESPAKARTIGPLLGQRYAVRASIGHVRDLPKSRLGVDTERDFEPRYLVLQDKRQVVKELKAAAKEASAVYLATDPDREGEAIAWHLIEAAELADKPLHRVAFHEITPEAILEAFQHPREIDMHLVQAQQARRVLDRLVGYSLSPVLWRKVRGRLSAGRVQSAALRMVVEREREIQAFVAQEYWTIEAVLGKEEAQTGPDRPFGSAQDRRRARPETFSAELVNLAGQRGRIHIPDAATAEALAQELRPAGYRVKGVATKRGVRQPEPPFTTSTLQQEAARRLRFTAQRTMAVAQQLYEGLDVGERAPVGLITYMRTDSVQVAESAIHQARAYIQSKFGGDFLPKTPRRFTRRARGAQEAHEAIRPTSVQREPASLRSHLTADQYRLYDLIWKRMVASQMATATTETTTVDVDAHNDTTGHRYLLRAAATRVVFPGYQLLYQEGRDDDPSTGSGHRERQDTPGAGLPALATGDPLRLTELEQHQHFTQPPPRYTDATLIRALEANGIGRPSTYASILTTLQERGYVRRESRQFVPQELGFIVNDLLTEHFSEVVDLQFTARMEEELDDIAAGKRPWVPVIREFYNPFHHALEQADAAIEKVHFEPEPTGELCEQCGKLMVFRMGRYGRFQACSGFPQCRNTKPILKLVGVPCPKDGGELAEKRARARGRLFYGCANFPACDFTTWEKPLPEPCPQCGGLRTQPRAGVARCTQCGHTQQAARRRTPPRRATSVRTRRTAVAEPVVSGVAR